MHYTVEGILCQDYICLRKSSSLFRCLVYQQLTLVIYIKNYFGLDSSHESAFFFGLFLLKQKSVKMAHLSKQEVIFFIFYSLLLLHGGWPVSAMYFLKMNNSVFTSVSVGVCVCVCAFLLLLLKNVFDYWSYFSIKGSSTYFSWDSRGL